MKSLSILIVDDEFANCENLTDILELAGHQVEWATRPTDAIERVREAGRHYFDLLLLDFRMPEMNGAQLLEKLKEIDQDLTAILISAYSETDEFTPGDRQRFVNVLTKPVDIQQLNQTIDRLMPLVICIDDDDAFRGNLTEIFATKGIRCRFFGSLAAANRAIGGESFDVALVDLRLGMENGMQAARIIQDANPSVRTIMITGYPGDLREIELDSEAAIHLVIEKPVDPGKLIETIENVCRHKART